MQLNICKKLLYSQVYYKYGGAQYLFQSLCFQRDFLPVLSISVRSINIKNTQTFRGFQTRIRYTLVSTMQVLFTSMKNTVCRKAIYALRFCILSGYLQCLKELREITQNISISGGNVVLWIFFYFFIYVSVFCLQTSIYRLSYTWLCTEFSIGRKF